MRTSATIRHPEKNELVDVIARLNEEFIYSRNRKLPIENRFSALYEPENIGNLFGIFLGNELASFVAVKPVTIVVANQEIQAFFVGSVYTRSEHRGRGYASQLVRFVQKHYLSLGLSLGFLWTGNNKFYEKLGWKISDNGVLVTCNAPAERKFPVCSGEIGKLTDNLIPEIDAFRTKHSKQYVQRLSNKKLDGYNTVYSPGEDLLRLVSHNSEGEQTGYLLGVANDEDCYVYEIVAVEDDIDVKLNLLGYVYKKHKHQSLKINLYRGDMLIPFLNELYRKCHVKHTSIQMTYCGNLLSSEIATNLYIPFSDRI